MSGWESEQKYEKKHGSQFDEECRSKDDDSVFEVFLTFVIHTFFFVLRTKKQWAV